MKIIYVSHLRYPSEKTHSQFAMKTCEKFAELGHEVELWVAKRKVKEAQDPFEFHQVEKNFTIKEINAIDIMGLSRKLGFILHVISFSWNLSKEEVDNNAIIYGHDARDLYFLANKSVKLVLEVHDFYRSVFAFIHGKVFKKLSGFVVTNAIKIEDLKRDYKIPESRMLLQKNAVDFDMFNIDVSKEETRKKLELPLDEKIVLYIGHLFKWKGVYTLAEASSYLSNANIFFLGGTKFDREVMKKYVEKKDLSVSFIEHVQHKEVPLYMKCADVLVLPNSGDTVAGKYETSPVKLFEYLASGVPVVTTDLPSIREIANDSMVTFVKSDDAEALAEGIRKALGGGADILEKTNSALVFAKNQSWERRAKNISTFLENLFAGVK